MSKSSAQGDRVAGMTNLTQVGTNFYLDNSTGVGPSLKLSGADVVAGAVWPLGANRRRGDCRGL